MSTLQRIRRLLADTLRINEDRVTPDTSLKDLFTESGGGSLDSVEFIMALEEKFVNLELPDAEVARWDALLQTGTVPQLADFIDQTPGR